MLRAAAISRRQHSGALVVDALQACMGCRCAGCRCNAGSLSCAPHVLCQQWVCWRVRLTVMIWRRPNFSVAVEFGWIHRALQML